MADCLITCLNKLKVSGVRCRVSGVSPTADRGAAGQIEKETICSGHINPKPAIYCFFSDFRIPNSDFRPLLANYNSDLPAISGYLPATSRQQRAALAYFRLLPVTVGRPNCFFDNSILLLPENRRETSGRAGGGPSADVSQGALYYLFEAGFDELPAAHILRFFLHPAPVFGL